MRIAEFNPSTCSALCFLLTSTLLQIDVSASSQPAPALSGSDKCQIVRSVLYKELTKRESSKLQTILLLNNDNVRPECLPVVLKVKIELLDQAHMQSSEDTDKRISYYFIGRFEIKRHRIRVSFGKHEQNKRSSSGTGTIYEYLRVSGKWKGKPVEGFGYCSAPGTDSN